MRPLPLSKAFALIEPGPVVLVTTRDGDCNNVMTLSWTMALDFKPQFTISTGALNHSLHAVGDGTFVVVGRRLSRRKQMAAKSPEGV